MDRPIAFFDFDGTLTRRDSFLPFLLQVRRSLFLCDILATAPWLAAYALHVLPNDRAKEAILKRTLAGMHIDHLRTHGEYFAAKKIPQLLRDDTMNRLREHRHQGHICVLVSASLDIYLEPWRVQNGFDFALTSSLDVDHEGFVTGKLRGRNCFGQEKAERIRAFLNVIGGAPFTFAYGDSKGDQQMISLVDSGHWVK